MLSNFYAFATCNHRVCIIYTMQYSICYLIGNENLYLLTSGSRNYKLRIDMVDSNGSKCYAEYEDFRVESEAYKYRLIFTRFLGGNCGKSLPAEYILVFTINMSYFG